MPHSTPFIYEVMTEDTPGAQRGGGGKSRPGQGVAPREGRGPLHIWGPPEKWGGQ